MLPGDVGVMLVSMRCPESSIARLVAGGGAVGASGTAEKGPEAVPEEFLTSNHQLDLLTYPLNYFAVM
jgi:hypothetical protein